MLFPNILDSQFKQYICHLIYASTGMYGGAQTWHTPKSSDVLCQANETK